MFLKGISPKVFLYLKVFTVDLLYVSVGCVMTWTSPLIERLELTPTQASWVSSLMALGATIGPAILSVFMARLSRKYVLLGAGCAFLIGWAVLASSKSFPVICVGRLIGGAAVGISFISIPVYLTEISDIEERQAVTTFVDFFLGIGFLIVYYCGPILNYILLQAICAVLTLIFLVTFSFLPESPIYLASRGRKAEALKILTNLRNSDTVALQELDEIEKYVSMKSTNKSDEAELSLLQLLKLPGHTKALILSILVMIFQQTSGITIFICFTEPILSKLTLPVSPSLGAIIYGTSNLPCILISPPMARYLGTKQTLIITSIIMAVSMIIFTIYNEMDIRGYELEQVSFIPILALTIFSVFFCSGVGPLSWTMVAEISPAKLKGFICFISTAACWLTAFILLLVFETATATLSSTAVYGFFSISLIISTVFFKVCLPSTKGLSLQEIQNKMNKKQEISESI